MKLSYDEKDKKTTNIRSNSLSINKQEQLQKYILVLPSRH